VQRKGAVVSRCKESLLFGRKTRFYLSASSVITLFNTNSTSLNGRDQVLRTGEKDQDPYVKESLLNDVLKKKRQ